MGNGHRSTMYRAVAVFLLLPLILSTVGCADPYTESMRTSAKFSDTITDGGKLVGELYDQKLITREEKNDLAGYFIDATHFNQQFRDTVTKIHTANVNAGKADYIAAADVFLQKAGDPTTLQIFHVKDATAQARIQVYAASFKTALDAISLAISKAKGK